jgi:single-stranded-DNA-specific exonuclease
VTVRHYQAVRAFAPFGVGNPEPLFLFKNMTVQSAKKFGKQKNHLECTVSDGIEGVTAFTFFASDAFVTAVVPGAKISFLAQLDPGYRGGVRLRIKELCSL